MCVEYVFICACMIVCASVYISTQTHLFGVATMGRLLKIIGLFCRIWSLLWGSFAKETYNLCLVDVRIFVCECLCMCTCIRVCIIVYIYTQICADKLKIIKKYVHTYSNMYIQIYTHKLVQINCWTDMHARLDVHVCS